MKPKTDLSSGHLCRLLRVAPLVALLHTATAQTVVTQAEPDDTLATANATGIAAGSSTLVRASGNNGDGAFGGMASNGDIDFFKLSANAGQTIQLDLKNNSDNDDFDSAVGLYNSAGVLVARNDDAGFNSRSSKLNYVVPDSGDYYVCVSNWININGGTEETNFPTDPTTAGTMLGAPGGTPGPYLLYIGLDSNKPFIEFDGSLGGNPRPGVAYRKVPGTTQYTGKVRIKNTGFGDLTISGAAVTGANAAKFSLTGMTAATIYPNNFVDVTVRFDSGGSNTLATAALDFTSNDPYDQTLPLKARGGLLTGGGFFTVRELMAATGITEWTTAGQILDGTIPSTTTTAAPSVINYSGSGDQGFFPGEAAFPAPGDQFVTEAKATLNITQAGLYTFRGFSDDGQRLFVDNVPVGIEYVDYSVPHFYTANLTVGQHTVTFQQFEGGGGDHMELSIAQETGTFTDSKSTTWELLESWSADTDGDGLPDDWEYLYFPGDLTKLSAAGDFDADGSPDKREYAQGTNPKVTDTDGDGLLDGVETGTGKWVSATDTGSDPTLADSDGDGIPDNQETNTGTFVSLTNPGSNPNLIDTDGDGIKDRLEALYGTNPSLPASMPFPRGSSSLIAYWPFNDSSNAAIAKDVIAGISGNNTGSYSADAAGRSGLAGDKAMFFDTTAGEQLVTVTDGSFLNLAAAPDSITISYWQKLSEVRSSSAFWGFSPSSPEAARGIQAHSTWGDGNIYFDTSGCCDNNVTRISGPPPAGVNLLDWHHFAFVKSGARKQVWVDGQLALDGTGIALRTDFYQLTIGGGQGNFTHGLIDDFAVFAGGLTPAQIARLAAGDSPPTILSTPPSVDFRITGITRAANGNVTLTWNSEAGATYTVQSSTDMVAAANWTPLMTNITSGGATTTTTVTPPAGGRIFLRVVK